MGGEGVDVKRSLPSVVQSESKRITSMLAFANVSIVNPTTYFQSLWQAIASALLPFEIERIKTPSLLNVLSKLPLGCSLTTKPDDNVLVDVNVRPAISTLSEGSIRPMVREEWMTHRLAISL